MVATEFIGAYRVVAVLAIVAGLMVIGSADAETVAHWTFDEGNGATTLSDVSGNGNDGTPVDFPGSGMGVPGQVGGAWDFTTQVGQPDQYVDLTDHLASFSGLPQGSISAWVNYPDGGGARVFISAYDSTVGSTEGRFFLENNDVRWDVRDQGGNPPGEGGNINAGPQTNDTWHHVLISIASGNVANLYVDGQLAASGTQALWGGMVSTLDGMAIGRNVDSGTVESGGQWFYNGLLDDMYVYDFPLSASNAAAIYQAGLEGQSLEILGVVEATVDRDTGEITLTNNAGQMTIVGYSLTSEGGALDPSGWTPIAGNTDINGDGTVDPNDAWVVLTDPASRADLSEFEPGTMAADGATLAVGASLDFGPGWIKNPTEDIALEVLLDDGTVDTVSVRFTGGPNDGSYEFGDLNFDGTFDESDFYNVFVPHFGQDTTNLSRAERYQVGDFNADNSVDEFDFLRLNEAFLTTNPGAASLTLVSVPEPSTLAMLGVCGLLALLVHRRRVVKAGADATKPSAMVPHRHPLAGSRPCAAVTLVAMLMIATPAHAANIISHWSFDETAGTTLTDSTGNHEGTAQGELTASANTGVIGNAWDFPDATADYVEVAAPDAFTSLEASYSFSMWFKTTDSGPSVMWSISDSTAGSEEVAVRINDYVPEGVPGGVHYHARPNITGAVSDSPMNDDLWHHVVVTQAETGWGLYVDGLLDKSGPEVTGPALIGADTVGIGRNVDSGGGQWPYNGLLDDMSIWDAPLTADEVKNLYLKGLQGIPAPDPFTAVLSLEVNTGSGAVTLKNESGTPFDVDLYRIVSPAQGLDPAEGSGWLSLEDQEFDGTAGNPAWAELGTTAGKLSEGYFGGHSTFGDGVSISLGNAYDTSIHAQDLAFQYHLAGTNSALLVDGAVDYISDVLLGDANGDGQVNGLDVDPFVNTLLNGLFQIEADMNQDGVVNGLDVDPFVAAVVGGGVRAVPEPSTLTLLSLAALIGIVWRKHSLANVGRKAYGGVAQRVGVGLLDRA